MTDDAKKRLNSLLETYDQQREAAKRRAEQVKREEDAFADAFLRFSQESIEPLMREIGNQIATRGHKFKITKREPATDSQGRERPAGILLEVVPESLASLPGYRDKDPHIGFFSNESGKKVVAHVNALVSGRSGHAGPVGEFSIAELTQDKLLEILLKGVKDILGV